MNVQLINGQCTTQEAIDLITELVQVKIKFLEKKISNLQNEEDIKTKETKIVALQNNLSAIRQQITLSKFDVTVSGLIEIKV